MESPTQYTHVQVRPEVISAVHSLFKPDARYLQSAEFVGGEGRLSNYKIRGEFNIANSGHWAYDPGVVHAQDSEAAAAQLGYALFLQGSMDGLFEEIPTWPLERLMEVIKNKSGGAWLYEASKRTSGALAKLCPGTMEIARIRGGPGLGFFVDTVAVLGTNGKSHRMDMQYVLKF